ncbi:hypothetical protein OHC33_010027 [Knufia fluminis]|uniref:Uncharacterized protein n=1 Tax=Knufia fluminis TaxID=191047 RepID=A0AAN8EZA9_9EURO|nr:hypothetical protein OHC33_010027 [Knufia fluminis]
MYQLLDRSLVTAAKESVMLRLIDRIALILEHETPQDTSDTTAWTAGDLSAIRLSLLQKAGSQERTSGWLAAVNLLYRRRHTSTRMLLGLILRHEKEINAIEVRHNDLEAIWRDTLIKKVDGLDWEDWNASYAEVVEDAGEVRDQLIYQCVVLRVMEELLDALNDDSAERKEKVLKM